MTKNTMGKNKLMHDIKKYKYNGL